MTLNTEISNLLNNQPNDTRIGCSRYKSLNVKNCRFDNLCRSQQIYQIKKMLGCEVDMKDLETELYLVSHKSTQDVWEAFGLFYSE